VQSLKKKTEHFYKYDIFMKFSRSYEIPGHLVLIWGVKLYLQSLLKSLVFLMNVRQTIPGSRYRLPAIARHERAGGGTPFRKSAVAGALFGVAQGAIFWICC